MAHWLNKRRHLQLLPRFSPTAVFTDEPIIPTIVVDDPNPKPDKPVKPQKPDRLPPDVIPPPDPPVDTNTVEVPPAPEPVTTSSTALTTDTPTTSDVPTSTTPTSTFVPPPTTTSTSSTSSLMLPSTAVVVQTTSLPVASTSAANAAASTSKAPSGGLNTGVVVGGIAGALAAIAAVVIIAMFFLRRWRKQGADENAFNASAFRHSAILVEDSASGYGGGRNPRPPTMIERKMANTAPSMGHQTPMSGFNNQQHEYQHEYQQEYGQQEDFDQPQYPSYPANVYGAQEMGGSFSPGQVVPSPTSPQQNPFQSPISATYDNNGVPNDQLVRQPSAAHLSRQTSSAHSSADYVDMSRSSVTPYQAAQYAEINRRLRNEPAAITEADETASMRMPSVGDFPPVPGIAIHQPLAPPHPPAFERGSESPFADPQVPDSRGGSIELEINLEPPTPARARIPSTPPILPEITPSQKTFSAISPVSYDFPVSARPNSSSFDLPRRDSEDIRPQEPAVATKAKPPSKMRDTVYTVYGPEEDAYGGI